MITRFGLTPWITEASVLRLTTLDDSSDVMCAFNLPNGTITWCGYVGEILNSLGVKLVELLESACWVSSKILRGKKNDLTSFSEITAST